MSRLQMQPASVPSDGAFRFPMHVFPFEDYYIRAALALSARSVMRLGQSILREAECHGVRLMVALAAGRPVSTSRIMDVLRSDRFRMIAELLERGVDLRQGNAEDRHGLAAYATALLVARNAARFIAGDISPDPMIEPWRRSTLVYARMSVLHAIDWVGVDRLQSSPSHPDSDVVSIHIAAQAFRDDLSVFKRHFESPRIFPGNKPDWLGEPVDVFEGGPFGPLWNEERPDWAIDEDVVTSSRRSPASARAHLALAASTQRDEWRSADIVFWRIPSDASSILVAAVVKEMQEVAADCASRGLRTPSLVVHSPGLPAALAGELTGAGAFYLPDPQATPSLDNLDQDRERIAVLIGSASGGGCLCRRERLGRGFQRADVAGSAFDPDAGVERPASVTPAPNGRAVDMHDPGPGWPVPF